MMPDPDKIQTDATYVVLHAWIATYLRLGANASGDCLAVQLESQAQRLRESAIQLQAALEKMRIANAKLAVRMAEHKAFFAKYKAVE